MYTFHYPKEFTKPTEISDRNPTENEPFESLVSSATLVRCPSTISFSAKENKCYYPSPNPVAFP